MTLTFHLLTAASPRGDVAKDSVGATHRPGALHDRANHCLGADEGDGGKPGNRRNHRIRNGHRNVSRVRRPPESSRTHRDEHRVIGGSELANVEDLNANIVTRGISDWICDVGAAGAISKQMPKCDGIQRCPEYGHIEPVKHGAAKRRDRPGIIVGRHAVAVAGFEPEVDHEMRARAQAPRGPAQDRVGRRLPARTSPDRAQQQTHERKTTRHRLNRATVIQFSGIGRNRMAMLVP